MSTAAQYPYDTRLNVLYEHLQLIDEKALSDAAPDKWYNQTLCQVNGSVARVGVVEDEYHWHKHEHGDEFFYVVEGKLLIDLEGGTAGLRGVQGSATPDASAAANGNAYGRKLWNCADRRSMRWAHADRRSIGHPRQPHGTRSDSCRSTPDLP